MLRSKKDVAAHKIVCVERGQWMKLNCFSPNKLNFLCDLRSKILCRKKKNTGDWRREEKKL